MARLRLVGLIPAAGSGKRLAPLPCSKELLPVGFQREPDGDARPKPVSQYLLEKMCHAGAKEVYIVLRSEKWDILRYYGDGSRLGIHIAYLIVGEPYGPPFTVGQASPFVGDATVLFGFPDILFQPEEGPALGTAATDVVEMDGQGRVVRLETKEERPTRTDRDWTYVLAAWRPTFTDFLSAELARLRPIARAHTGAAPSEWPMGAVIAAAARAGLHVNTARFDRGTFLDVGTSHGLLAAAEFPGVWRGVD